MHAGSQEGLRVLVHALFQCCMLSSVISATMPSHHAKQLSAMGGHFPLQVYAHCQARKCDTMHCAASPNILEQVCHEALRVFVCSDWRSQAPLLACRSKQFMKPQRQESGNQASIMASKLVHLAGHSNLIGNDLQGERIQSWGQHLWCCRVSARTWLAMRSGEAHCCCSEKA